MSDEGQEPERPDSPELRPVVARLQEIHRKCLSLGSRNDEAREMASHIEGVIAALSADSVGDAPRPALGDLARELFPVARLFESLGFLSVARELAHVEKTLIELEPVDSHGRPTSSDFETSARIAPSTSPEEAVVDDSEPDADDRPVHSRRMPVPVAFGLLAVLVAVLASILIVRKQEARYETGSLDPTPSTLLQPAISASPTQLTLTQVAGSLSPEPTPTPGSRARIASIVGEARLAQREGDIDQAISLLSQAALIESKANLVIGLARSLVDDLLNRADDAAAAAHWDEAAQSVERARELAIRFELPTAPMDAAVRRHARLERYESVAPTDAARLKELAGNRAIVVTNDDGRHEGQIHDVVGGVLELHQGMEVGRGGTLFHVDEILLADVVEIRVYPD